MPRRRRAALPALLLALVLAGCSGGDDEPAGPGAAPTPTAVGDRPLVEVLDAGAEDRRVLAFEPVPDTPTAVTLEISQQVTRDEQSTRVPPLSLPLTTTTAVTTDGGEPRLTATQTYAQPTVDATGLSPADVAGVREALSALAGTTSTLVVRPDGTTVETASGDPAATPVDGQLRDLVAVLPSESVGIGARWSATSVEEVDGAVVDQVATYTLTALEGTTYDIDVTIERTYRPGQVEDVEVRSGRGTVTARLTGSLDRVVPQQATGNVATQVSYVVDEQVTEVRTTIALDLTSG